MTATELDETTRAELQTRTLRTLMVGVIPAGLATSAGFSAAALLGEEITGSKAWGGFAASAATVGAALITLPLARHIAKNGRGPGLLAGWAVAVCGALVATLAALTGFYPLLPLGMLGIGAGSASNLNARYGAADLATDATRAKSIGTMMWAVTVGSVVGPTVALGGAGTVSEWLGLSKYAGPFVVSALFFGLAFVWIKRKLHPDPLVAAGGLDSPETKKKPFRDSFGLIWHNSAGRLACLAMVVGHMVMVGVMIMTPLHMKDGDHEVRIIGFVISVHVVGMYAFSPLVGWLVDKVGPRIMIATGGVILFSGAELAAHTDAEDRMGVFVGLFLVGLGWSFCVVSGSSLLTGSFSLADRVSVQGAGDLMMVASGAGAGLSAGVIADWRGYHSLSHWAGLIGLALSAVAVVSLVNYLRRPIDHGHQSEREPETVDQP
ncbi:MAG: MFS transporter [Acidimicrobiales bacterium]